MFSSKKKANMRLVYINLFILFSVQVELVSLLFQSQQHKFPMFFSFLVQQSLFLIIIILAYIQMQNQQPPNPLEHLKSLQLNILSNLQTLSQLNQAYRSKQQKQFITIFLSVMDKMSNQLTQAKKQYQNIDRQIEKDEKCVELSTKLKFFRTECCFLKEQLIKVEEEIKQEKDKQKEIVKDKLVLQAELFQKSKQIQKYKSKARSLQKRSRAQTLIDMLPKQDKIQPQKLEDAITSIKKHSLSQTKNTKQSFFTNNQPTAESPRNLKTSQAEFRIKAAKMAKQRKMLMNKTYYSFSNTNKNKIRPETQGIQR